MTTLTQALVVGICGVIIWYSGVAFLHLPMGETLIIVSASFVIGLIAGQHGVR